MHALLLATPLILLLCCFAIGNTEANLHSLNTPQVPAETASHPEACWVAEEASWRLNTCFAKDPHLKGPVSITVDDQSRGWKALQAEWESLRGRGQDQVKISPQPCTWVKTDKNVVCVCSPGDFLPNTSLCLHILCLNPTWPCLIPKPNTSFWVSRLHDLQCAGVVCFH